MLPPLVLISAGHRQASILIDPPLVCAVSVPSKLANSSLPPLVCAFRSPEISTAAISPRFVAPRSHGHNVAFLSYRDRRSGEIFFFLSLVPKLDQPTRFEDNPFV